MPRKPGLKSEFVLFDVVYEDGTQRSNRKVPRELLGGLDGAEEEALADYGRYAGLAFQLVDDLLDFTASTEQLGKPVLSDLKEGKVTLPLIYALARDGAAGRKLVAKVLEEKDFVSVKPEQITRLVHETGALDRARSLAREFADRAQVPRGCGRASGDQEGSGAAQSHRHRIRGDGGGGQILEAGPELTLVIPDAAIAAMVRDHGRP